MAFAFLWPSCGDAAFVRPFGATDAFGYDGLGNWTTFTNAEGRVYTMAYDALGRIVAATNAASEQVFANRYDPAGNLTNRTDGAGNSIASSYDELNRLVMQESGVGSPASSYSYDPANNLLTASNATAYLSFGYDAMDRLTSAATSLSNATYNVTYHRDAGGLVTNLVYASGKVVTRAYDPDGRLASVSDWLGHTWTFAWDGTGKPTGSTAPGGILATNHYDAAGRLTSWSVGALAGRAISRDLAGLKTREDVTAGPHPVPSFVRYSENTFDAADRLVTAQVRYGSHTNAAVTETYQYDGNGALTNLVSGSNAVFSAAYDPLGQLSSLRLSASARDLSYDALGNRLVSGDRLWIPDHADPLKRPLIEADAASGVPIRYYLWGPGRLLGFIDAASGVLTVAHCDDYGSVVTLTDSSGATLHTASYGPNGQDWGQTGTNPTPFGWLGGHGAQHLATSDHLGPLYLTRYRLYAASLQRFLSADPLGLAGGLNLYAYAEGDPLSYIDPLGLGAESVWGAAASGFLEGLGGGLSILANTATFGGTDALGWTDSTSYEGGAYTASRVAATVARETAIAAATLGIGTAARGGSTAAQAAYKGILATQAATGGYQIGTGASQIAGGDYEAGTVNVVAGSLRVSGSIASAGAISQSQANWTYGDHKSAQKFHNQMQKRGWPPQQIDEAMTSGNRVPAPNQVNPRNTATRYVHPTTGRSVVVDNVTHEVLHVGGDGFRY
jgi:RHS repeat-associated protein